MRPSGVFSSPTTAPVFTQKALSDLSGEWEGTAFNFIDGNYIKHYALCCVLSVAKSQKASPSISTLRCLNLFIFPLFRNFHKVYGYYVSMADKPTFRCCGISTQPTGSILPSIDPATLQVRQECFWDMWVLFKSEAVKIWGWIRSSLTPFREFSCKITRCLKQLDVTTTQHSSSSGNKNS